jgi:hypothetical protein
MLFADIDSKGILKVRATEPIEAYALQQWEIQRDAGADNLVIETDKAYDVAGLAIVLGSTIVEFQKWYRDQKGKAVIDGLETKE